MPRSLPSKLLIAFSSLLLAHACYSAHEHSLLSTTSTTPHGSTLPADITLETLVSVSLLLFGIVSSGWELKPISLRVYAGGLESGRIKLDGTEGGRGRSVYEGVDERGGFLDVRKQRREFMEWMKTQG